MINFPKLFFSALPKSHSHTSHCTMTRIFIHHREMRAASFHSSLISWPALSLTGFLKQCCPFSGCSPAVLSPVRARSPGLQYHPGLHPALAVWQYRRSSSNLSRIGKQLKRFLRHRSLSMKHWRSSFVLTLWNTPKTNRNQYGIPNTSFE